METQAYVNKLKDISTGVIIGWYSLELSEYTWLLDKQFELPVTAALEHMVLVEVTEADIQHAKDLLNELGRRNSKSINP